MLKTTSVLLLLPIAAAFVHALTGEPNQSNTTATPHQDAATSNQSLGTKTDTLATVNGTPIGEADVRFALSSGGHNKEVVPKHRKNVLDVIIQRELISQRAVELGLDANAGYQEKLRRMEAQFSAFKREELSQLFWREMARRTAVSEAEAEKYFADHAIRIRTELHVWQILLRDAGSIEQALNDLKQGTSFEEVAAKQLPKLPKTAGKPWDLGYMRWNQVPTAWGDVVYDLEKGEVSGVLRGPKNRFWIIKLIDKRENPDITLERIKPTVMEVLKNAKIEELHERIDQELRAKANIVYLETPYQSSEE